MKGSFAEAYALILEELAGSLGSVPAGDVEKLSRDVRSARRILVVGAGRMGILLSAFSMRLNHLGFSSFLVGSPSCPPIAKKDLLLVASSSGETPTVREVVKIAHAHKASISVITAVRKSTIARMATSTLCIQAPSALEERHPHGPFRSAQPMKSLFEQTLYIVLESLVLMLMRQTGQAASDLAGRHANLE